MSVWHGALQTLLWTANSTTPSRDASPACCGWRDATNRCGWSCAELPGGSGRVAVPYYSPGTDPGLGRAGRSGRVRHGSDRRGRGYSGRSDPAALRLPRGRVACPDPGRRAAADRPAAGAVLGVVQRPKRPRRDSRHPAGRGTTRPPNLRTDRGRPAARERGTRATPGGTSAQGYVIEETPLGVLCYHKDDGEEPWDDTLQAELDQEAERIDRAIQESLEDPPESDDTSA